MLTVLLDIFKLDPNYLENEEKYKAIKAEILGEGSDEEESGSEESSDGDESDEEAGTFRSYGCLRSHAHAPQLSRRSRVLRIEPRRIWSTFVVSSI